ncbi:hypothetical protein [Streptomyces sp. 184]|uniref:hypothetical protein n=1 Tax=Streptomyces sp. 184 TaxID=1827526 RepID=UPI00389153EC
MSKEESRLTGFEERLLGELKRVVAERGAAESPAVPPVAVEVRAPRRRLWVGLTATAGVAAAGVTAVVALPAMGGSAAYAVETNDDGTVTATIKEFTDAEGLERQLEEHGVSAEVDYMEWGQWCQGDRGEGVNRDFLFRQDPPPTTDGPWSFTVRPADLGPGETLVIETARARDGEMVSEGVGWQLVTGPVRACHPSAAAPGEDEPVELPGQPTGKPLKEKAMP